MEENTGVRSTTAQLGNLGREVGEGAALVGGAAGIAQSARNGDPLGIAAGVLEVTAAVAGGLLSFDQVASNAALSQIAKNVAIYGGLASAAASSADAFARGDLAGGLASSLNVLLSQVAQRIGERAGPADRTVIPAPGTTGDDLPLPVPPIPPEQPTGTLVATDQTLAANAGAIPGTDYITFTPSQPTSISPIGILGNLVGKLFRVSGLALNVANILFESSPVGFAPQQGAGALPDGIVLPYSQSEGYVTVFTPSASGTLTYAGNSGVLLNANGDVAGIRLQVESDGSLVNLGGGTVGYVSDAVGVRIDSTFLANVFNNDLNDKIQQAIRDEVGYDGTFVRITKGPNKPANLDPELGAKQVRYYVDFMDEFKKVTNYSVNYDPVTGRFGIIKPSSGPS